MAKGNLILGTMSGKLGDIVAYTNNGKQCARVRRRVVRNPNSEGQQIQRMILTTVSQFASALRPVLNNAFEGVQKGAPSLAYARKLGMRLLRTEGMWGTPNGFAYTAKGSQYMAPNPYQISRGSLYSPQVTFNENGIYLEYGAMNTQVTLKTAFPWAEPGMQITLIVGEYIGETTDPYKVRSSVRIVSFVPKDNSTPMFVEQGGSFKINPAAVESAYTQGDLGEILFSSTGEFTSNVLLGNAQFGGAVYSTRDGSRRSTAFLVYDATLVNTYSWNSDQVLDSYDTAGVATGAPAEYYLDQNPG